MNYRLFIFIFLGFLSCRSASAQYARVVNNSSSVLSVRFYDGITSWDLTGTVAPHSDFQFGPFPNDVTTLFVMEGAVGTVTIGAAPNDNTLVVVDSDRNPVATYHLTDDELGVVVPDPVYDFGSSDCGQAFGAGFVLMALVRIFRAGLRWFKRAGTERWD